MVDAQRSLEFSMGRYWVHPAPNSVEHASLANPLVTDAAGSGSLGELQRAMSLIRTLSRKE